VSDFISHWSGAAVGAPKLQGNDYRLDDPLPAGQDFIVYSGATNPDPAGKYGLMLNGSDATLDVGAGTSEKPRTVIWLLPHGAYFDEEVTVTGNSLATLIMVVGASSDTSFSGQTGPMLGLHTGGGMTSPSVSVFLVSDGSIVFDRTNSVNASSQLNVESIFARGVYLKGPSTYPGALFTMHHDMDANEKTLIDHLYEEELLPNTLGSGHHFTLLPGWSDSLTTN
jgi:hypothetical protein